MLGTKNVLNMAAVMCLAAGAAHAQTTITLWNFNAAGLDANSPAPAVGTGTATLIGGVAPATSGAFASQSGSSDPAAGNAWNTSTYPAQGTASGTAGLQFAADCTGRSNISFELDLRTSSSASRYWDFQYSTTGPAGPWTSFDAMPYATVGGTGGANFGTNLNVGSTFTLPASANNNPNVVCRIVSVFDPAGLPTPFEYARLSDTNPYASTGTIRVDMVEFRDNTPVSLPPTIAVAAPAISDARAACAGSAALANYTVNTTMGLNPPSTTVTVTGDFSALGGSTTEPMIDLTGGNYGISFNVPNSVSLGMKTITFTITDDLNRSSQATATFGIGNCSTNANSSIVISQIFGGGGNGVGDADYVVLHNRGCQDVDIANWSLQYGTAAGVAMGNKINLPAVPTVIPVGGYYLIQTDDGAAPMAVTPDVTNTTVNMGGVSGRVAIVNQSTTLVANPVTDPSVMDFVGYGNFSANFEGAGSTLTGTSTSAYFRKQDGNQDSNENFNDFDFFLPAPVNSASPAIPANCTPGCPADLDNGSGTGTPDGGVDINDLLYFLAQFELGSTNADLDNGSGTGTPDGGTDINDLLFFLVRFEAGC